MDIQGYEWPTLKEFWSEAGLAPDQIGLELHFGTQMPGLSWFGRLKSPAKISALGSSLALAGYHISKRNDNPHCMTCTV